MIVGVPTETFPGERRVALVPAMLPRLKKVGLEVVIQAGAGRKSGFADALYEAKGAKVVQGRAEVFSSADVIARVRTLGANPVAGKADLELLREGQLVVGFAEPLSAKDEILALAARGVSLLSMELMPRITRAQSMDALSSMATIAGYKAVLMAAERLPKLCPMMMTAAGTIQPASAFVIGAGVAGLQAIATARRIGAVVSAYDLRPAVKEQVESVGAKFIELELDSGDSEDKGGYAKAMGEDFYRRQREMMGKVVSGADIVITTAAIPGRKAPILVTEEMVKGMPDGGVIVDLAAERGGNCELTRADEVVEAHGVTILGPSNVTSTVPHDASQMYASNVTSFLQHLAEEGEVQLDQGDEITQGTLVCHAGKVVHGRVIDALDLEPPPGADETTEGSP